MKKIICLLCAIGWAMGASAQDKPITHEETVRYINKKLGGKCSVDVVHGVIQASFFEDGVLYRKDKVKFEALDIKKRAFEKEENIFFIPCHEEECVERKLLKDNIKKFYSRFSFALENPDEKTIQGLKNAFMHIYNLDFAPPGYQRTEPLE